MSSLLLLLASPALAFPNFDVRNERVVLGEIAGISPAESATPWTQGTWQLGRDARLVDPVTWGDNLLVLPDASATLGDGLVRMRVRPGSRMDLTLMARVDVGQGEGLDRISGYGLSLTGGQAQLFRWDGGLARPLAPQQPVDLNHEVLEVVWQLTGPFLTATIYDGKTFELLGATSAHDPTFQAGRVGLRAYHKQDPGTRVTAMSVMGDQTEAGGVSFSNQRHILVTKGVFDGLPSDLQGLAEGPVIDIPGKPQLRLLTADRRQAERLRRLGIDQVGEMPTIPFGLLDMDYQRARQQDAPIRTDSGFVVDASYKDPDMVEALLEAYAERFPEICRLHQLGTSHRGQPLWALKISDNPEEDEAEPAMFLNGSHHGNELLSVEYALDAMQQIIEGYGTDPRMTRYVDDLEIWVMPLVNPDGNKLFMTMDRRGGRKNGRDTNEDGLWDARDGVDLNRNYPFRWASLGERGSSPWHRAWWYRGEAAGTEPEVQAVMKLANDQHFAASLTYHTVGSVLISPYSIDGVENPQPDVAWKVSEQVVASLPRQPNGKSFKVKQNLYAVDGVDQDWHYHTHGTMALLLEGSHHNPSRSSTRKASVEATRPAFSALFDRFLDGPSLSGVVVDGAGEPVTATVQIAEVATRSGEVWTTRPRDGRFDRFLPSNGTYTVQVSAEGYRPVQKQVRVTGHGSVEIVLAAEKSGSL